MKRWIIAAVAFAQILLLITAWAAVWERSSTGEALRSVAARKDYPYVLAGAKLSLNGVDELQEEEQHSASRKLLLVTSDSCRFCRENLESWRELVRRIDWSKGDSLWILSFDGTEVADQLRQSESSIRPRLMTVRDKKLLIFASGINSTPITLVLDSQDRVLAVQDGVLSRKQIGFLADLMLAGRQPQSAP